MNVKSRKFLITVVILGVLFQAVQVLAIPTDSLPEPDESPPRVEVITETQPQKKTTPDREAFEQCRSEYQKKQYQSAIALCTKTVSVNSNHAGAYLYRAYASEGIGNYQDAVNDYTKARQILPWGDLYLRVHLYRGKANYWAGKYDEAVYDLGFYLQNKSDKEGFFWRGRANLSSGKYDAAVTDFDQVINTSDSFPSSYRWRGDAYRAIGKYDLAIADYSTCLADSRNEKWFPIVLVNRAISYWWKDRGDLAGKDLAEAIRLEPNYAYAYNVYGDLFAFYARRNANKSDSVKVYKDLIGSAVNSYTMAIKHSPDYSAAYNGRANCYGKLGRFQEALIDAKAAFDKGANKNASVAFNIAQALEGMNQKDDAHKWYEYAERFWPKDGFQVEKRKLAARLSGDWSSFKGWL